MTAEALDAGAGIFQRLGGGGVGDPHIGARAEGRAVDAGDTLGAIAQKYYGKASEYMKIFEANRDILDNPDLIKVGQKLKIPE